MSTISQDYKLPTVNLHVSLPVTQLPEDVTTITNLPVVLPVTEETQIITNLACNIITDLAYLSLVEQLPTDIWHQIFISKKNNYSEMLKFHCSCSCTSRTLHRIFQELLPQLNMCKSNLDFCLFWKNTQLDCKCFLPNESLTIDKSKKVKENYKKFMFESCDTEDLQSTEIVRKRISSPDNELDFSFNFLRCMKNPQIQTIPNEIGLFTNLIKLDLLSLEINSFPEGFSKLTNLQYLDLWDNNIQELPDQFSSLTNLQSLGLACNAISIIPDYFSCFTNLIALDAAMNKLQIFPTSILTLTQLKTLQLDVNLIKEIPTRICSLTTLEQLEISGNSIENPLEFFQKIWGNYTTLHRNSEGIHCVFPAVNVKVSCDIGNERIDHENVQECGSSDLEIEYSSFNDD